MLKIKNLRGQCQHCGGPIEFHAEHAGNTAACPHCGAPTELLLALPPEEESPVRRKAMVFTLIASLILVGGLVGAGVALKRAKRMQAERMQHSAPVAAVAENPFARQQFSVSVVTVTPRPDSELADAVGIVSNLSQRPRYGVKVEVQLYAATGEKLGVTHDYLPTLEAGAEWKFRALVGDRRATAALVAAITETP